MIYDLPVSHSGRLPASQENQLFESTSTMTPLDPGLRAKLLTRSKKHRGIRAACLAGAVLWSAVEEVDRDNRAFLSQQLVSRWLGAD